MDRINNDLGYTPENIQFVTRQVNLNNKRDSVKVDYFGAPLSVSDAIKKLRLEHPQFLASDETIKSRLYKNHNVSEMLKVGFRVTRSRPVHQVQFEGRDYRLTAFYKLLRGRFTQVLGYDTVRRRSNSGLTGDEIFEEHLKLNNLLTT